jgi:hypothetical protein
MTLVHLYMAYTDMSFGPSATDAEIARAKGVQVTRDAGILSQMRAYDIPDFPMQEDMLVKCLPCLKLISAEHDLLSFIFVMEDSGSTFVLFRERLHEFEDAEAAFRWCQNVDEATHLDVELIRVGA